MKKHWLEQLTPIGKLEVWGMRITAGSLKDPLAKATGGRSDEDDELALCRWLESLPGFAEARPLLCHLYARFKPLQDYGYTKPGESRLAAAIRHGQAQAFLEGKSDSDLARILHGAVLDAIIAEERARPFKVPRRVPEPNIDEIVAQIEVESMLKFANCTNILRSSPQFLDEPLQFSAERDTVPID